MLRKYFGDKAFYKMICAISIPIMLQNLITNFVSMLDNIMVGAIGTEQMSAVTIVNQLLFVFNLTIFGALSGAGIFTSQFYGKNDQEGISHTVRYKIIVAILITTVATVVLSLFGRELINLYLHDGSYDCDLSSTLLCAESYLRIMLIGLPFFALSQVLASSLRETGETFIPMVFGIVAVVTNCTFNYLLIFGKFGFPYLGTDGAAIATVISRVVEAVLLALYTVKKRARFSFILNVFRSLRIPKTLFSVITRKGMPLLLNEMLWSIGISLQAMCYSLYGLDVVAANSICSTVVNLFNISFMAFGTSIGIVVGKQLGAGKFEEAVDTNRKMLTFSILISIGIAAICAACGGLISSIYNTSEASRELATSFIRIACLFMPVIAFLHGAYFCMRSGGKTIITFIFDAGFVLAVVDPVSYLLCSPQTMKIETIFFLVYLLDILKAAVGYYVLKKRIWVNNIVKEL